MRLTLRPMLARLKHVRFSLGTLLLLILTLTAGLFTWVNRHPWELVRSLQIPDLDFHITGLADSDEMVVWPDASSRALFVWDSTSGHTKPVTFLRSGETADALAPRRRLLATIASSGCVRLRDLDTGAVQAELDGFASPGNPLHFSDDDEVLAGIGTDGGIRTCRLSSRAVVLLGHLNPLTKRADLKLSSDGRYIQVYETGPVQTNGAVRDGCLDWRLFDCTTAEPVKPPEELARMFRDEGSREASFQGCPDRIFVRNKCWVVGTEQTMACPGAVPEIQVRQPPGLVPFYTAWDTVEVRSGDLTRILGRVRHGKKGHGMAFIVAPAGNRLISSGYCACWYD